MDSSRKAGAIALKLVGQSNTRLILLALAALFACHRSSGQVEGSYGRSFFKSKADVEQALKDLQVSTGEKLPILDGFVGETGHPLDRYERGFCKFTVEVVAGENQTTVVTLKAKITAWYADRDVAKSGYEVLPSNGRLELDLLDRLEEKLTGRSVNSVANNRTTMQTPHPKLDLSGAGISGKSVVRDSAPPIDEVTELRAERLAREKRVQQLTSQLQNLQDIQKSQARPQNLVIIQKSRTPIYAKSSSESRVLFQAEQNDEFEFLDGNSEWIHISISGDSRGYVQRSTIELSAFLTSKLESTSGNEQLEKFTAFRIEREEIGTFPGSWPGLAGKTVKIYTVSPVSANSKDAGPTARLNYALLLFQKGAKEASESSPNPLGVIVIYDSADGGIVGATLPEIEKVSSKSITREVFWNESYLDPSEAFRLVKK
jgi:hypothetical protein